MWQRLLIIFISLIKRVLWEKLVQHTSTAKIYEVVSIKIGWGSVGVNQATKPLSPYRINICGKTQNITPFIKITVYYGCLLKNK